MSDSTEDAPKEANSSPHDELATSHTLLGRLQDNPQDEAAWNEFSRKYGTLIRRWCGQWRLQAADIEDVTQNVLLEISRKMQIATYRKEGRFRSWLKTIAFRAWCDYLKKQQRPGAGSGDSDILKLLNNVEARDDLMRRLDEECRREMLEAAMLEVRSRVHKNTFEAWRLMTFERLQGKEVAERLNMKIGAVFVGRSRVDQMLTDIVSALDPEES